MKNILSNKYIIIILALLCIAATILLLIPSKECDNDLPENDIEDMIEEIVEVRVLKYGLPVDDYVFNYDTIRANQTLAAVLYNFAFSS